MHPGSMKGKPIVILMAEDNDDHASLIGRSFNAHRVGNQLFRVRDGEEALDYLYRRGRYADPETSPRPDVFLLDLRLPKIDGFEILREIKNDQSLKDIPVVVLTSSADDRDIRRAYDNYANSYLVKPVDFTKFSQLLDDFGFYWLAWNKSPKI